MKLISPIPRTALLRGENRSTCTSAAEAHADTDATTLSYIDEGWDFSDTLETFIEMYRIANEPIVVNYRDLVPYHSGIDRLTHLIHSYPAKLLLNIPLFFLRCEQIGASGCLGDPFCGSGTVLVEGALKGWRPSGADTNPLARLLTKVKLTYLDPNEISDACARICEGGERERQRQRQSFSPVVDVDYWFAKRTQRQLGGLFSAIEREQGQELRNFFQVCLSSCIRKVSFADPRLSVPVRVAKGSQLWRRATKSNVVELFRTAVKENSRRVSELSRIDRNIRDKLQLFTDARQINISTRAGQELDLIITSPPYAGAQKYIRASSLNIGWLGLAPEASLRTLEKCTIGREHYRLDEYAEAVLPKGGSAIGKLKTIRGKNPLRAHIASNFLIEMEVALLEMKRSLRRGGTLLLIVGNNTVVGEEFPTSQYVKELAEKLGLRLELELVDHIRSRGLMTKRNTTAGIISREYVQMFKKS